MRVKGKFLFNRTVGGESLQTARITETQSRKKAKVRGKYDHGCIRLVFLVTGDAKAPPYLSPSVQMIASYLVWSERLGNPGLKQHT